MAIPCPPESALHALIAWWRAAGVDVEAPPPAAQRPARGEPGRAEARRPAPGPRSAPGRPAPSPAAQRQDALALDARAIAARCATLDDLETALQAFEHPLRAAARSTVFARGDRDAAVMVVGEAPGSEEDAAGLPFVGKSGQLLDRMFAEIGLTAQKGLYITNVVNWRPRSNRTPSEEEVTLCRPFIARHIALKRPRILVLAGAVAAQTVLGTTQGITRLRGRWTSYAPLEGGDPVPALPIFHPAYILRRPISKRETWRDLLSVQERLSAL